MKVGLRTTIFWNITLLMTAAVILISLVVLKVTEREMLKQQAGSAEAVFGVIESAVSQLTHRNTAVAETAGIKPFMNRLVRQKICTRILWVSNRHAVIADTGGTSPGTRITDMDLRHAHSSGTLYQKIRPRKNAPGKELVLAGPVFHNSKPAGFLKVVLPADPVQDSIARAEKIILMYILFDGIVLVLFGFFLLSRYLVNPINKLIKMTETLSEGNLTRIPLFLSDKNEVGKLSAALNTLSDNLQKEKQKIDDQFKKLAEQNRQLKQARDEIIQAEKLASVGRLAAGIAHEIGNPVGIILGYIHMLRDRDTRPADREDYLDRMEKETERVNRIIQDFLNYSRPGNQTFSDIDLNRVLREAVTLVSCQKDFNHIHPVFDLADTLPLIRADIKEIQQLLINLLLNARDAMPDGGTLTLGTALDTSAEEDKICLTIADTGIGIPEKDRNKIFDPFFTTKTEGRGTGLGLSNVHRIVQSLQGTIECSSRPGKGTTFIIHIPVPGRKP